MTFGFDKSSKLIRALPAFLLLAVLHCGLPLHLALSEHLPLGHDANCVMEPIHCDTSALDCRCKKPLQLAALAYEDLHCEHLPHDLHEHQLPTIAGQSKQNNAKLLLSIELSAPCLLLAFVTWPDSPEIVFLSQNNSYQGPPRGPPFA